MKYLSLPKSLRFRNRETFFFLAVVGATQACGPDFPNRYLDLPAQTMLAAPEGYFAVEIERLAPAHFQGARESQEDTREIDDVRQALAKRGEEEIHAEELAMDYKNFRAKLQKLRGSRAETEPGEVPAGLPPEFAHYLAGARAWHENDIGTARAEWRAVLALPAADRQYRSTWAAYMLGRSVEGEFPPDEAHDWFVKVRDFAKCGFADSINLAGASDGIEAHWAMALQDYAGAINLYLDQYSTGDESAYASLRLAAAAAAAGDERRKSEIARDLRARQVVTVWFLARFVTGYDSESNPRPLRDWTAALVRAQVHDVDHADRLAWLAYEAGDFEMAKTWAGLAADTSAETHWIRGKLALRDNRLCDGAKELGRSAASAGIAPIYRSTVLGELGRVQLALDRREAALTSWLDGTHWEDAAYVAERLLTIDELKIFCASYRPARLALYEPYSGEAVTPQTLVQPRNLESGCGDENVVALQTRLSELLARRLVRAGRIAEAKNYFCAKNQATLAAYATEVQAGFNIMLRPKNRARAFWRAAQLVREEGMVLMGAELEPDFGIWDGSFAYGGGWEERAKTDAGLFSMTKEEKERLSNITMPAKRFSYRYRAADLAWWAASLLPNEDPETAVILNTAGGWLKSRDPLEANRFYQALVIRCGHTQLGKIATELHWFPAGN